MTDPQSAQTPQEPPKPEAPSDESHVIRERQQKAARLREGGLNLFAQGYAPTRTAAQAREGQEALIASQEPVAMAGRILLHRPMGKAGFFTFLDQTGRFQAYVKKDQTDAESFDLFNRALDVGDIVGVEGPLFITKKGELTIQANAVRMLTKAMRPLPEKWHGLKDMEERYRHRYVDLIVNPEVREAFAMRSRMVSAIRAQLDAKGYIEVETPMMQLVYGGAAAKPFTTRHNALDLQLYLRIAPELFLKRLLVGGMEKVYEINRNFRNEGLSTRHNPEFTMLELYTAYWDYRQTLDLTEEIIRETARRARGSTLLSYQGAEVDLAEPFERTPILHLVARALGLPEAASGLAWGMQSVAEAGRAALLGSEAARLRGPIEGALAKSAAADEALIHLFEALAEPEIVRPTFVLDFPKSLCPLAKSSPTDPATAERFELFCCGLEVANAYSELNDPAEQLARFQEQVRKRAGGDEEAMNEVDWDYIRALEHGMPPASGLGIGIDRLAMLFTDSASIRDVILFPLMRPEAR